MRRSTKKADKAGKGAGKACPQTRETVEPELPFWTSGAALVFVLFIAWALNSGRYVWSSSLNKMQFPLRLVFFFLIDMMATDFFTTLMLQVGRAICGDAAQHTTWKPQPSEVENHNRSIEWPQESLLPAAFRPFAKPAHTGKQPFFLNHATGAQRCKAACMRCGMMAGSVLAVCFCSRVLDNRDIGQLGLVLDGQFAADMLKGIGVGAFIVSAMFAVELALGWVKVMGFCERFDRADTADSFGLVMLWEVLFHVFVSINEEITVRGWVLMNAAEAIGAGWGASPLTGFGAAISIQALLFVAMHLTNPGGTQLLSMVNIGIGGVAGGLNVLLTGSLAFSFGWHFGWNIFMGNVWGMSTSAIPIGATLVSIAPHPQMAAKHGGVFGPEGGVVSPAAYALGIVLLGLLYTGFGSGLSAQSLGASPLLAHLFPNHTAS